MINKSFLAILGFSYTAFSCDYMIDTFANHRNVSKCIERVAKKYNDITSVQFNNKEFSNLPLSLKIAVFLTKYRIYVDKKCDEICENFPMFSPENKKYRQSIYSVIPSEIMRAFFKIDYENIFDLKRYCPIEQWTQANFNYLTLLAFIVTQLNGSTETYIVQDVLQSSIENNTYRKYKTRFIEAERQMNKYIDALNIKGFISLMTQMFDNGKCLEIYETSNSIGCRIYNDSRYFMDFASIDYNNDLNKLKWINTNENLSYNDLMMYYKKYRICSEYERANKVSLINGFLFGINASFVGLIGNNDIVNNIEDEYEQKKDSLAVYRTYVKSIKDYKSFLYDFSNHWDIFDYEQEHNKSAEIEDHRYNYVNWRLLLENLDVTE